MTPAARVAAAIEVLDDILSGTAPEPALTGWGRAHRFAGSKDRAAIRDHVFDALRCRSSYAWMGGAETGRGIMLGAARAKDRMADLFTGEGHAPVPPEGHERGARIEAAPRHVRLDVPDWLLPKFDAAFGAHADDVMTLLRQRARVFLRVNVARTSRADARAALALDGIQSRPVDDVKTALEVTDNPRKVAQSRAYLDGIVEVQDTASQAAVEALDIAPGMRVLDYCAGGGGKALAIAALGAQVVAHDIDPRRMADIAPRAARAGVRIDTAPAAQLQQMKPFDLVFCDAPCSGSGTWRRAPQAKWDLTRARLEALTQLQDDVLRAAAPLVASGGRLAYATCSVFEAENTERIQAFLAQSSSFEIEQSRRFDPHARGDGFYLSVLKRTA